MPTRGGYDLIKAGAMSSSVPENDVVVGLPTTHSSQQLMPQDVDSVTASDSRLRITRSQGGGLRSITRREWWTVSVLCFVNLINYMDRFTIAGILPDVQKAFNTGDDSAGLLQTVFVISYMICAPIFGYLGDRYSRRIIMGVGVALWSATTLAGSFMSNYGWFITFRALVGIGEASYSTIAPTIISDLFVHDLRSKMLALFYFAIPVGSGLGYIIGSKAAVLASDWRFALRVTPIFGVIAVIMIIFVKEPERGQSEGSHNLKATTYLEDLNDLVRNPSFMLSTLGFTCVAFVAGALAFWGPTFIFYGLRMQPGNEDIKSESIAFIFGALTMVAGIIGVPLGTFLSGRMIKKWPRIDPCLCAIGLVISAALLFPSMIIVRTSGTATYVLVFLGELALNMNWAIVADILLYVVVPTRRSTAEAFQILISHALGDAGSPYLIGVVSELLKKSADETEDSHKVAFESLQYALFTTCFVELLGGVFFLFTARYIIRDKKKATKAVKDSQTPVASHTYADCVAAT